MGIQPTNAKIMPVPLEAIDSLARLSSAHGSIVWTAETFTQVMQSELGFVLCCVVDGSYAGFAAFRGRERVDGELIEILVAPIYRNHAIGSALLSEGCRLLAERRCENCYLEVRINNRAAQRFYLHQGFSQVGVRPRFYADTGEDAVIMQRILL